MYLYTVVPLDTDHIDEICEDIIEQFEKGVANCALFCMALVPEGDPPIPKAEQLCEKFDLFRSKLAPAGVRCGMLMQASIGHGSPLDKMFAFTRVVDLLHGQPKNTVCPYDEGFRDYIRQTMRTMASHRPDCIMVDDDFRLIMRPGKGCVCDLHLRAFEQKAGVKKSREELLQHVAGTTDEDKKFTDIFVATQVESLVDCAKAMREGIDSVDPTIPGSFCCCGNACEGAAEIAAILAGKGNPVIVRVNNGNYTPAGGRYISEAFMRAAVQATVLKGQGDIDVLLAETDTCPQNRYSTGARSLHAHFTGSILEGAAGAKHWITRMRTLEQRSGKSYRDILSKYSGFYNALSRIVPTLKWRGCRMPLSAQPDYGFTGNASLNAWTTHLLERLGLPVYFSAEQSKVAFLEGEGDALFTDEQLLDMLGRTLVLDGAAAERLAMRGFAQHLGVEVRPWEGGRISGELFTVEGGTCNGQVGARELIPLDRLVQTDSVCYHLTDGVNKHELFPGCTIYRNSLGGTAIIFCGNVRTQFNYLQAFSFLNETRKRQLVRLLSQYGDLPLYYPDDAEVYLRVADCPDGSTFCAFFNIGLDPIERITLCADKAPECIELLAADGTRQPCGFTIQGDVIKVDVGAETLSPVVLFIK